MFSEHILFTAPSIKQIYLRLAMFHYACSKCHTVYYLQHPTLNKINIRLVLSHYACSKCHTVSYLQHPALDKIYLRLVLSHYACTKRHTMLTRLPHYSYMYLESMALSICLTYLSKLTWVQRPQIGLLMKTLGILLS